MIAQIVGAQDQGLAFIIMLAAPGIPVVELMTLQNEAVLLAAGVDKDVVKAYRTLYRQLAAAIAFAPAEQAEAVTLRLVDEWVKKTPKEKVRAATGISDEASKQKWVASFMQQAGNPWFTYFLRYNPDDYLRQLKAKVLALNGGKDVQVVSAANLAGLRASLKKSKSPRYDIVELKGLNHLFQRCNKCTVDEYGALEQTIAPEALQAIGDWLVKEVKNK